ncbi:MAG: hypothetical protein Q7R65_04135 [bacterium]|nr:hypothetical protein [bacterium]
MDIVEIFKKSRHLSFSDLEAVAAKYVRETVFKVLFSRGGVAPLTGSALKSGKKYDIYLSDDLEDNSEEQVEVFVHELLHVWLFEECKVGHRDEYESEIRASAVKLASTYSTRLQALLDKYLVK